MSAAATSRTWVTPPDVPSDVLVEIVWIESMIRSSGLTASMWEITALRSFSAASQSLG